ncbi:hypothetical protein H0H81_007330 [Sphagnurus paluster]|uniref:Cytochrome P450 n=1 Tax=Sphagnurus paluster TaxID=117069 RepID=A0A9P7GRR2_9AGAR|nr:hypothetical protein H0H81_007330 [Sphagnurus paluster]
MERVPLLFTAFSATFIGFYLASSLSKAWSDRKKLNKIPTIGPSGVLSSYMGAWRMFTDARGMIQEGYEKYRGTTFKFPGISGWTVVISDDKLVEELRKATDDQVSAAEAINDQFQVIHTISPEFHHDPYHNAIVRSTLTRNIGECFPEVQDELVSAFSDYIPATETWTNVVALPTIMKIVCRMSNRLFVGLPLCRDPDYRTLNVDYTVDVMKGAHIINVFPNLLKPLAGYLFTNVPSSQERAMAHLAPIIEERIRQQEQYGKDWPGKPNDYLSWLLDVAEGPQRTVRDLTMRILGINFVSIHTTSMAFTQVLFDVATFPSYVPALREEIEQIIREEGLTKASLGNMWKLDSFIKESQRLGGNSAATMSRKVLKDFTFSDGTLVPAGHTVAVPNCAMHHDEDNYGDPNNFDGFRFANLRESEDSSSKYQMVTLNSNYMVFGYGRHACPGRFFAVNEIKALMVHVLLNYDVSFETNRGRPEDTWFGTLSAPDPSISVMFRKRRT